MWTCIDILSGLPSALCEWLLRFYFSFPQEIMNNNRRNNKDVVIMSIISKVCFDSQTKSFPLVQPW